MNSLGTGVKTMRTMEDVERVARDLQQRHAEGSIGHVLGGAIFDLLNAGRYERVDTAQEHTEGAPETSPHCDDLAKQRNAYREQARMLGQEVSKLRGELRKETADPNAHRDLVASMRREIVELRDANDKLAAMAKEPSKAMGSPPRASVEFEARVAEDHERPAQPDTRPETDAEFHKRVGLDAVKWAKEFVESLLSARMRLGSLQANFVPAKDIEEAALGWFANAFHAAETYVPRNKCGDVLFMNGPNEEQLSHWQKEGMFDHYSDAARMVMDFCRIPAHKYIQVQNIMERFGDHKWAAGAVAGGNAKADAGLDIYGQAVKDSAARLKNVLDREGLLPPDRHPEDHQ